MRLWAIMFLLSAVTACAGTVETLDGRRLAGRVELRGEDVHVRQGEQVEKIPLADVFRVQLTDDVPQPPILDLAARDLAVVIGSEHAIPLNQSTTDSLNGRVGILRKGDKSQRKLRPGLTDARTASQPSEENGWLSGDVTWDMGGSIPAEQRQLDSISIWIRASDSARCDYAGAWAVSNDGENFTEIAGTRKTITFGRNARDGTYNHVVYNFAPGRVTGFRYLRLIAEKPADGEETRYVEVDAFVSRVDPNLARQTSVVTRHGTVLVGSIVRLDGTSAVIEWRKILTVPRPDVAGVRFFRMNEPELLRLAGGRRGALLATRDFLESELKGIQGGAVRLDSILFGRRQLEAERDVLAIFLSEIQPQGRWRVGLTDGSVLLVRSLKCEGERVVLDDACLGEVEVVRGQVACISPGPDRIRQLSVSGVASAAPRLADYRADHMISIPSSEQRSFDIEAGMRGFWARVGTVPSPEVSNGVRLIVLVDDEVRYSSDPRTRRYASATVFVPLNNARRIVLRVEPAGDAKIRAEGLFADAVLVR